MGATGKTTVVVAMVIVVSVLVLWQVVNLGNRAEGLAHPTVPKGEVRDALNDRLVRHVNLKTARPNLWIHLSTHDSLPHSAGTMLPGAPGQTTVISKVPAIEQLCAYSVMFHNVNTFNVVLVTDDDLNLLLPGWSVNMAAVPEAGRRLVRDIAMLRIVYHYGGMLVPSTFAATGPFAGPLSSPGSVPEGVVLAFEAPTTGADHDELFAPSGRFLYSRPLNPTVKHIIDSLAPTNGTHAQAMAFHDKMADVMLELQRAGKVRALSGGIVGTQDADGRPVTVADALDGFPRAPGSVGITIPDHISTARKYGWLDKETPRNILAGSTWLAAQIRQGTR
jgi:hypothetical protein